MVSNFFGEDRTFHNCQKEKYWEEKLVIYEMLKLLCPQPFSSNFDKLYDLLGINRNMKVCTKEFDSIAS